MMNEYDVIIIGGGPGGYAAAVSACGHGLKTALVERELLGGVCVNFGCIPTKALIKYAKIKSVRSDSDIEAGITYKSASEKSLQIARERREQLGILLNNSGVDIYTHNARLTADREVELQPSGEKLKGENIIIATGSRPRKLAIAEYEDTSIVTTKEALTFDSAPSSVVVVGAGSTGIEMATVWNRFGAKTTVLEYMPTIMGMDDIFLSETAKEHFRHEGMTVETGVSVEEITKVADGVEVSYKDEKGRHKMLVEKVLVAAGIAPNSEDLGLEELGVEIERGFIMIDDQMRTTVPNIYAVGDVTGKLPLAFVAAKQAKTAIADIVGEACTKITYENIPRCTFSAMEMATAGLNERQAGERGYDVLTYRESVPSFDGRTTVYGGGFIKLVADAESQRAIGVTLLGVDAANHIAGPAHMIAMGATAPEIISFACNGR